MHITAVCQYGQIYCDLHLFITFLYAEQDNVDLNTNLDDTLLYL